MIGYQAVPGARVVIKGSRVLTTKWGSAAGGPAKVWSATLSEELFEDYNPFEEENINAQQFEWMDWARPQRGNPVRVGAPETVERGAATLGCLEGLVAQSTANAGALSSRAILAKRPSAPMRTCVVTSLPARIC
ncbi:MAG: hypothetical protein NTW87_08825 [Planctomycetota bacterium]|nr:hypothetical protein [Planctomycetota bacterium]